MRPEQITAALWPIGEGQRQPQVHILMDGALDPSIANQIRFGKLQFECLFGEPLGPHLRATAPYLVHLSAGSPQTNDILRRSNAFPCGIFITTPPTVSTQQLCRHFKKLLWVRDESGRRLYFRYYDPRVLAAYLPNCTEPERQHFFGPVDQLHILVDRELRCFSRGINRTGPIVECRIREEQFLRLQANARQTHMEELAIRLESYVRDDDVCTSRTLFLVHVEQLVSRAGVYELESWRDVFLFAVFALQSKWHCDSAPEFRWAHALLTDVTITSPGARLLRLLDEAIYRRNVERNNRVLVEEFTG